MQSVGFPDDLTPTTYGLGCRPPPKFPPRISRLSDHKFTGRREDNMLVRGQGRYTTYHNVAKWSAAAFLRADRAHAKIVSIDTEAARQLPGVIDVVTGDDIVAMGWKGPPVMAFFKGVGGSSLRVPFRPGLAQGRVRFVGEPVALV